MRRNSRPDAMWNNHKITLASASPRRRELLEGLDIPFTVEPAKDEKEAYTDDIPWQEVPEFLARHKSESFHRALESEGHVRSPEVIVYGLRKGDDIKSLLP